MVTISLGVPTKMRSSRTLPPATKRYSTVNSINPLPMSALPFHVPTSVFMRANSAEGCGGLSPCSAFVLPGVISNETTHSKSSFVVAITRPCSGCVMRDGFWNSICLSSCFLSIGRVVALWLLRGFAAQPFLLQRREYLLVVKVSGHLERLCPFG